MTWSPDLLTGVAQRLADLAGFHWADGAVIDPGDTRVCVTIARRPDAPDRLVVVNPYPIDTGVGGATVTEAIQVRYRGTFDPATVLEQRDDTRRVLDGLGTDGPVQLGGVWVAYARLQSGTEISFDGNQRAECFDNFYLVAERPTLLRHDN